MEDARDGRLPVEADDLLYPERLWARAEVLALPSLVPPSAGVYAWYFRQLPGPIDTTHCVRVDGLTLLYLGISPKAPPSNGGQASRQNLRRRLRQHYALNAYGSTLRLTLVLAEQLGLQLRRVGSGTRLTFADGEAALSRWMADNALVCWTMHPEPWELEDLLVATLDVPLNLQGNSRHAFSAQLRALRAAARSRARALPAWPIGST